MYKQRKKIVWIIFLAILLIIIIFGINKMNDNNKNSLTNSQENIINNDENNSNIEITTATVSPDEDIPEDIKLIKMSQEDKMYSVLVLDSFENGKTLTTEQYLNVVYNALNYGYISVNKKMKDNKYTEDEINNIVYTIFGTKLKENKSIQGLKYQDGIYEFEPLDDDLKHIIKNSEAGAAAGNVYVEFELYMENILGSQEYKGKYTIILGQNTETGERYIKSMNSAPNN